MMCQALLCMSDSQGYLIRPSHLNAEALLALQVLTGWDGRWFLDMQDAFETSTSSTVAHQQACLSTIVMASDLNKVKSDTKGGWCLLSRLLVDKRPNSYTAVEISTRDSTFIARLTRQMRRAVVLLVKAGQAACEKTRGDVRNRYKRPGELTRPGRSLVSSKRNEQGRTDPPKSGVAVQ